MSEIMALVIFLAVFWGGLGLLAYGTDVPIAIGTFAVLGAMIFYIYSAAVLFP